VVVLTCHLKKITKRHKGLRTCSDSLDDQDKEGEMGRTCSTHGNRTNTYLIFVEKPERKRSLGRPKHRWEMDG
jgi:hypothetical protein